MIYYISIYRKILLGAAIASVGSLSSKEVNDYDDSEYKDVLSDIKCFDNIS